MICYRGCWWFQFVVQVVVLCVECGDVVLEGVVTGWVMRITNVSQRFTNVNFL